MFAIDHSAHTRIANCNPMIECLLVKSGTRPQEEQSLLELEPVDVARRIEGTTYLSVPTIDSIIKVVSKFSARDRRGARRCLVDKIRILRNLKYEVYQERVSNFLELDI